MNRICCVLLAMLPLSAWAYPIEVEKYYQGVDIDYTSHDTFYDTGAITVNNYGSVPAKCRVVFQNGPEAPKTRRVTVAAKKSVDVSAKFNRSIIKLRIKLSCEPE
ncbi:hypothetical protein CFII64_01746 [Pseudomonas sp. CFII64]|uniref:hypothetical protein n=1 Tax=Pseudomonas sp. CFII64 TaxID=911242 RepID=UPI000357672B|nr:hypothetical protein [Pseudomonas sp. CFII64]EPJ89802.1 hypothetical protein CFII64_01746 [Pseudomonas sp. CFII64]